MSPLFQTHVTTSVSVFTSCLIHQQILLALPPKDAPHLYPSHPGLSDPSRPGSLSWTRLRPRLALLSVHTELVGFCKLSVRLCHFPALNSLLASFLTQSKNPSPAHGLRPCRVWLPAVPPMRPAWAAPGALHSLCLLPATPSPRYLQACSLPFFTITPPKGTPLPTPAMTLPLSLPFCSFFFWYM